MVLFNSPAYILICLLDCSNPFVNVPRDPEKKAAKLMLLLLLLLLTLGDEHSNLVGVGVSSTSQNKSLRESDEVDDPGGLGLFQQ